MNREKMRQLLQERGSENLYGHSCRVEEMAALLAAKYGADTEKAALAGLIHDYGKLYEPDILIRLINKHNINVDSIVMQEPSLLHAPVGAWLLEHELSLQDQEILDAVRQHTTGAADMSLLACIVYLADYIEPDRSFAGVAEVRNLTLEQGDLERALLVAAANTIHNVLQKGGLLHSASVALRNSMVLLLREKEQEAKYGEG